MGKKSIKENKNIYQLTREANNLTREKASELLQFISADKIEKIENEKSPAHPEEVLQMAKCYKAPNLCNYYCSNECPIGKLTVPEIQMKELSQITLEILSSLSAAEKAKDRIIEITVDGKITDDEYLDFKDIQKQLKAISESVDSLQLWVDKQIAEGKISPKIKD